MRYGRYRCSEDAVNFGRMHVCPREGVARRTFVGASEKVWGRRRERVPVAAGQELSDFERRLLLV